MAILHGPVSTWLFVKVLKTIFAQNQHFVAQLALLMSDLALKWNCGMSWYQDWFDLRRAILNYPLMKTIGLWENKCCKINSSIRSFVVNTLLSHNSKCMGARSKLQNEPIMSWKYVVVQILPLRTAIMSNFPGPTHRDIIGIDESRNVMSF